MRVGFVVLAAAYCLAVLPRPTLAAEVRSLTAHGRQIELAAPPDMCFIDPKRDEKLWLLHGAVPVTFDLRVLAAFVPCEVLKASTERAITGNELLVNGWFATTISRDKGFHRVRRDRFLQAAEVGIERRARDRAQLADHLRALSASPTGEAWKALGMEIHEGRRLGVLRSDEYAVYGSTIFSVRTGAAPMAIAQVSGITLLDGVVIEFALVRPYDSSVGLKNHLREAGSWGASLVKRNKRSAA